MAAEETIEAHPQEVVHSSDLVVLGCDEGFSFGSVEMRTFQTRCKGAHLL